jgi:hypothetical protein
VTPAPIIEDHAQRSRIPIATASSETEVAGEASMATDKLWSKKCSSSSSVADRRTGDGVRRQLEYALAPFIKEMKKDG